VVHYAAPSLLTAIAHLSHLVTYSSTGLRNTRTPIIYKSLSEIYKSAYSIARELKKQKYPWSLTNQFKSVTALRGLLNSKLGEVYKIHLYRCF